MECPFELPVKFDGDEDDSFFVDANGKDIDCTPEVKRYIIHAINSLESHELQIDLLDLGLLQEKNHIDAIKKQYNEDVMHLCENKPPECFTGYNACLSCKLKQICCLLYKTDDRGGCKSEIA